MIRKIEEKVQSLVIEATSILMVKDLLLDHLQEVSSRDGQLTAAETKTCYRLARDMNDRYRAWYSTAWRLVSANLTERVDEFHSLYDGATIAAVSAMDQYGRLSREHLVVLEKCLSSQLGLVRAIPGAIEASALSLRGLLARDLMGDELSISGHLLDNGFIREAGVVAGVVLERHLKSLCDKHSITVEDKDTVGSLNSKLRKNYPDDAEFRRVQFLSEVRALCTHDKKAEPDPQKVGQLISGVEGFISSIL